MLEPGSQVVLNRTNEFGVGVVIGGTGEQSHVVWHSGRRWGPESLNSDDDGAIWWFDDTELEVVDVV